MVGSLKNRGKNRWALILDLGYVTNPATGTKRRKQKWVSFHGNREQAGKKLTQLVGSANGNEFVEPSKMTVGQWLATWTTKVVAPRMRPRTLKSYDYIIKNKLTPALGHILLQALKPVDLESYYATCRRKVNSRGKVANSALAPATVRLHHAIISAALKSAVKQSLVTRNVAKLVDGLPRIERTPDDIAANVWTLEDARTFLATAKAAGPRPAAFYALALDSGARLSELCGLKWTDIDLDGGRVAIVRQLGTSKLAEDKSVVYGPTKTGASRTVDIGAETVTLLRAHKKAQAELKMKNRVSYRDHGLVFTKEQPDLFKAATELGTPIQTTNVGGPSSEFGKLVTAAGVKRITFHGMRHTCATLLLLAGEPAKVVSERLGHKKIAVTMDIYSHVLPTMGRGAADRLGALLHG